MGYVSLQEGSCFFFQGSKVQYLSKGRFEILQFIGLNKSSSGSFFQTNNLRHM